MSERLIYSSLTRIAPFHTAPPGYEKRARERWKTGDYVVVELLDSERGQNVELTNGRMAIAYSGARIVGALGEREATLEAVGSWRAVGDDDVMQLMTSAGLLGAVTSRSTLLAEMMPARYLGHATVDGRPVAMQDFVPEPSGAPFTTPVILIIGTSMSSGKTIAGRVLVRLLKERGHEVVGAKLTGAGRYRDVLSLGDAGADAIFDFVDGGLPSSICAEEDFRRSLGVVLDLISAQQADYVVAEAGASPLEPYNGMAMIDMLGGAVAFTLLAASDPYAVTGVMSAFDRRPDVVAGIATSTSAGIQLIDKLTGLPAVNVLDPGDYPQLDHLLAAKLGL